MPLFAYKAKDGPARTVEGELDVDSRASALARLEGMGLSPVSVMEIERSAAGAARRKPWSWGPVRNRDVTVFTRQLASLIRSGVPILRAMTTVQEQAARSRFRRILEEMRNAVREGRMLSEAMKPHGAIFSDLYVNMVRAGESGGVLDTILYQLADAREKDEETRRKVRVAVAYPCLVAVVGAVSLFVLFAFFLPKVTAIFESYDRLRLPLPTRVLMGMSDWCGDTWPWMLAVLGLGLAIVQRLAATDKGQLGLHSLALRLPLFGPFWMESDWARFSRTLALLIKSGVTVDRAIGLAAGTVRNAVIREEITQVARRTVQQGQTFSSGLRQSAHVPQYVIQMAAVGEETGSLDESLNEVAQFYERSLDERSSLMTSLLEPILILVVGGCVGFVVTAMLLPIFELSTGL